MKRYKPKLKIIIFFPAIFLGLFCFVQISYAATPTISNVSGTIQTGQTVTITGTSMVDENKTNWINFFQTHPNASNFEGANPGADGYSEGGTHQGIVPEYVTNVKLMGSKSFHTRISGASTNCPAGNIESYDYFNSGVHYADYYFRFYIRFNTSGGWISSHCKTFVNMGESGGAMYYFNLVTGSAISQFNPQTGASSDIAYLPYGETIQLNKWYSAEFRWKTDSAPYHFDIWLNGINVYNYTPSERADLWWMLPGLVNACGTGSGFSLDAWYDALAISTSRIYPASTIEVSNNSTYGAGTIRWQEPVYLSDGSVQAKLDLSALGSGPYYLWVTNNRQERSAAYALSGGGDTQAPTVPTNLTASAVSSSQINLSWTASTDNVGVTGYRLERCQGSGCSNFSQIATPTGTSYSDTGLSASTAYSYRIRAADAAGNLSSYSSTASATTQASPDTTPPAPPTGVTVQ